MTGFEPATYSLRENRSTPELHRLKVVKYKYSAALIATLRKIKLEIERALVYLR